MNSCPDLKTPPGWQHHQDGRLLLHADPDSEAPLAFALSVAAGLDSDPRWLDSQYLYDAHGSALFERITEQPEYYQTRTEDALLVAHAARIRDLVGDVTLVELGSGSSAKTRRLLDAWTARGSARYVPVDVSLEMLTRACRSLCARYPALRVEAVATSYERAFPLLSQFSPMTLVFLGSSIGNLGQHAQYEFLARISKTLANDDFFLVGLDFAHDAAVLEAAYADRAGWTARFTQNLFSRMNRELGTQIPLDALEHEAFYDVRRERIEIHARFNREVQFDIPVLGRSFRIARGERIRTEVSHKYRPETACAAIERQGFSRHWSAYDEQERFGLFLFRRRRTAALASQVRDRARWNSVLEGVRRRTLEIVEPMGEEDLIRQHSPLMSPIVWDLGHIASFEELWLVRRLGGSGAAVAAPRASGAPQGEGLDHLYDPLLTPRAKRKELRLPSVGESRRALDEIRRRAHERLERRTGADGAQADLLEQGFVVHMVAQHEAQHQETMLQAINLRQDLPYFPAFIDQLPEPAILRPPCDRVLVPGGPFMMGTNDRAWSYDNERPAHRVELPAFQMDVAAVTNHQYLAFIGDGGYRRRELWSEDGWQWRAAEAITAPLHWRQNGDGWITTAFGHTTPLDPDRPVVHVSWYEADAYARWAGKRLPTEAEWEKAAAWDAGRKVSRRYPWGPEYPDATRANLDQRRLEPLTAGACPGGRSPYGCLQMLGDVWEWTASWFEPYPGFRSYPYREYSEIFFGQTYRVLRGGSFATAAIVARNTVRNWDYPQRRQIFAGFRCAEDA
jgi:gamma-glutamyl hercynylcysteine S-oxide synthase